MFGWGKKEVVINPLKKTGSAPSRGSSDVVAPDVVPSPPGPGPAAAVAAAAAAVASSAAGDWDEDAFQALLVRYVGAVFLIVLTLGLTG
jgi:hypothetical protein